MLVFISSCFSFFCSKTTSILMELFHVKTIKMVDCRNREKTKGKNKKIAPYFKLKFKKMSNIEI
jgi:hypothetical protein